MAEGEHTSSVTVVPGVPEIIQRLPSDVMQVSEQMILLTWLAFGIAAFCLHRLLWKPILRAVEGREQSIGEALDGAVRARKEVGEAETRSRQIAEQAEAEALLTAEQAAREAAAAITRAAQEAKAAAQRRVEDAERQIAAAQRQAAESVRRDAAEHVGAMVERLLRGQMTEAQKRAYQAEILDGVKL